MVLFAFKDEASAEERESILAELRKLPSQYPTMQNWTCGKNISNRPSSIELSHAFVVEFQSQQDLLDYLHSDGHEKFVAQYWRRIIERQVIVSYEY